MSDELVLMSEEEARQIVEDVKEHLNQARVLLLELYEREGWRSLGYSSWRECVKSEFQSSESYLYRQFAAAQLESDLGLNVGESPESHLRPIIEVFGDDRQGARYAYDSALRDGAETANEFRYHAKREWLLMTLPDVSTLKSRVVDGTVSMSDAYDIAQIMADDETPIDAIPVLDLCTDAKLVSRLVDVYKVMPSLWEEIHMTMSIPAMETNIPLEEASLSNLNAMLGVNNAERRAQHVAINQDYYQEVRRRTGITLSVGEALARAALNIGELEEPAQRYLSELEKLRNLVGGRDDISPIQEPE